MIPKERQLEFMDKLKMLSRQYRIAVGGCGCCRSPYLEEMTIDYYDFRFDEGDVCDIEGVPLREPDEE